MYEPNAPLKTRIEAVNRFIENPRALFNLDHELVRQYETETTGRRKARTRAALVSNMVISIACISFDALAGNDILLIGVVGRLGLSVPLHLLGLFLLSRSLPAWLQGLAAGLPMWACVCVTTFMARHAPQGYADRYVMAAGMLMFAVPLMLPMRFRHALIWTFGTTASYAAIALAGSGAVPHVGDIVFFLTMTTLFSLLANRRREMDQRRGFLFQLRNQLQAQDVAEAYKKLEVLSNRDPLTNIGNRRYLHNVLERTYQAARISGEPIALLMIDVDHFKAFNDYAGHWQGDQCLREVAATIGNHIRDGVDFFARYGGEEFVVILPGRTVSQARIAAERIRSGMEAAAIAHPAQPGGGVVTVSIGVAAAYAADDLGEALLINAADRAVYRAKARGRNCVAIADETELPMTPSQLNYRTAA